MYDSKHYLSKFHRLHHKLTSENMNSKILGKV